MEILLPLPRLKVMVDWDDGLELFVVSLFVLFCSSVAMAERGNEPVARRLARKRIVKSATTSMGRLMFIFFIWNSFLI